MTSYVARPELHELIRKQLHDTTHHHGQDGKKVLAIWGLGGVGKTQLVLDYLQHYRYEYKATFWIEAGRRETIERDMINIYKLLFNVQMAAGQETIKADDAVLAVKSWFSARQDRWLLIFDGADDIDDEEQSNYIDVVHYLPESPHIHIVVTTRSRTAKDMTMLGGVEVNEMSVAEAMELFYRSSSLRRPTAEHRTETDMENELGVRTIVQELGCLALAVHLAGTYVSRSPRLLANVRGYLDRYHQRRQELLAQKPTRLIHQYSESVFTTWETSFRAVTEQCSEAGALLPLLAILNFDDIYFGLFGINEPSLDGTTTGALPNLTLDLLEKSLEILQLYSFVQWRGDQGSYSMHKLVHAWAFDRLTQDEQQDLSVAGLQLLCEAIRVCKPQPQDKSRLVPHLMANFETVAKCVNSSAKEAVLDPLGTVAAFIDAHGRWQETKSVEAFLLEQRCELYGDDHPSTISAMNNLANTLGDQGHLEEAAATQKEVLEKRRRILGDDHPDTISAMNNLAITLRDQNHLQEAMTLLLEGVENGKRFLGDEHPITKVLIRNLASTMSNTAQAGGETRVSQTRSLLQRFKGIFRK